jgi:uncharacterized protein YoxC
MSAISIAAVVVAAAFVVLVAFIVSAVIELRKTAQAVRDLVRHTDEELKPLMRDLGATVTDLRTVADAAAERVDDVKEMMEAIGETGRGLRTISHVVGSVANGMARSSVWISGAKVACSIIKDRFSKKGGNGYV